MDSKVMGYGVGLAKEGKQNNWNKSSIGYPHAPNFLIFSVLLKINFQFMFPVHFMDCWSLYILDTDKKIVMVLDPTETNLSDEMKIKHGPLARKFQQKLCTLFSDMFGAGLVETTGWSFVYPLVAQHEPCIRRV